MQIGTPDGPCTTEVVVPAGQGPWPAVIVFFDAGGLRPAQTRIAERIATLDLVSDGRCDFGTGEGAAEIELGGFNIPQEEKRAMWLEGLSVVTRMLVEEPFTGQFTLFYLD